MRSVDISNYTSPLTDAALAAWKADGYELAIVQALDSARFPQSVTREQITRCAASWVATDVYVYPFTGNGPGDARRRLSEIDGLEHLIGRVWLDAEDVEGAWSPADREQAVTAWLTDLDVWAAQHGKPRTGIYTAWWWMRDHLGYTRDETCPWTDRDLWDANYDGVADVNVFYPYCGFQKAAIKQYAGTSTLHGIGGVDLNAVSEAEAARVRGAPVEQPEPEPSAGGFTSLEADLISRMGYLHGDLVQAFRAEVARRSAGTGRLLAPRRTVLNPLIDTLERTTA